MAADRARKVLPLLLMMATSALVAMAANAPFAAGSGNEVRITVPGKDAVRTGRTVAVNVRTRQPARSLTVRAYGRGDRYLDISKRFRRLGPRRFTGRLRVGTQLRVGANSLFVEAFGSSGRLGVAERHFTVAVPVRGLLRLRRLERGRYERPPLGIEMRTRSQQVNVRARLNGRGASRSLQRLGNTRWRAILSAKDGLRYGRNRLVVSGYTTGGRFQRVIRHFIVSRLRPIADAGHDRLAWQGRPLRLSAAATRPTRRAGLRLRWRIVRKPRGAQPRLLNRGRAKPTLIADLRGRYRLRLDAIHRRPQAARSSAVVRSSDSVAIDVKPDLLPSGMPVETMATRGNMTGISIGADFFPMQVGATIQMLALDRTTLEPRAGGSFSPGEEQALLTQVKKLGDDVVVILSGGGRPYAAPKAVLETIRSIGGTTAANQPVGVIKELTAGNGGWSVIGIPGTAAGQAYQLIGLQQSANSAVGAIKGSFKLDSSGVTYAFDWAPEYHTFDTQAATTETGNSMRLDGELYPSWNLPFPGRTGTVGFQLLWFDADTLKLRLTATSDADLAHSFDQVPGKGMWGLRDQLRHVLADPKPGLLMLNTIGDVETPFYANSVGSGDNKKDANDERGDVMARVATLLESFGSNRYVFNTLGTDAIGGAGKPGGYSLVGVSGIRAMVGPNAAAELSTRLIADSTPRLAGVLHRTRQGVLRPGSTGAPGPGGDATDVQPEINELLAQPDQPFPSWGNLAADQRQAQLELAQALGIAVDRGTVGIRANYWQNTSLDWDSLADTLRTLCLAEGSCSAAATELAPQLAAEFDQVAQVRSYFGAGGQGSLRGVFDDVFDDSNYGLTAAAHDIRNLFEPPPAPTSGPNPLGIFGGVMGITGGIGGFVPIVGQEVAAATRVAAGISQIVQSSTADGSGASPFDPYGYNTTVATVAEDLGGAMQGARDGLDRLSDLLVSDAGRLEAAATRIKTSASAGGWGFTTASQEQLEGRLRQTMRQFIWLTLSQPVLATYECAYEDQAGVASHNPAAVLHTNISYPEWRQREDPRTFNLYDTYIMLAERNHWGWPSLAKPAITDLLFGDPDYSTPENKNAGFIHEYLVARSLAKAGPDNGNAYDQNVLPASPGLLRKDMGFDTLDEDAHGLAHRNGWTAYTPSCGWGQDIKWSDQDYISWASP